jgi:beta-lactam-binding protein with PASTA domain
MKRALRIFAYFLIFAALAAGSAYLTYRVMITRMTVEVPDLTAMSLAEADGALEARGLYLKVAGEDNDLRIPSGHVLSQDVDPGKKIKGMAEIKVIVSKGPAVKLISSVVGEKVEDALKLFTQKGLDVKVIKTHSDTTEKDTVIAQWPSPEEWHGQNITVVASEGPYEVSYYCPSFIGLLKEDALSLAKELDLKLELTEQSAGEAMVLSQKPLPGETIVKGNTLYLQLEGVRYD